MQKTVALLDTDSDSAYHVWAGERARRIREELGLTRTQLGSRIDRTPDAVGMYERGIVPPLPVFCALACSLGVHPAALLRPANSQELAEAGISEVTVRTMSPPPSRRRLVRRTSTP
jgi:transcriptional regulator with XRE-family HTH domain